MKTRTFGAVIAGLAIGFSGNGRIHAAVTVSPATGGTNISADTAANAPAPAWTTLGAITITEGTNTPGDFAAGSGKTLVLATPGGFQFNTAQIPSVTFAPGGNIMSASVSSL